MTIKEAQAHRGRLRAVREHAQTTLEQAQKAYEAATQAESDAVDDVLAALAATKAAT